MTASLKVAIQGKQAEDQLRRLERSSDRARGSLRQFSGSVDKADRSLDSFSRRGGRSVIGTLRGLAAGFTAVAAVQGTVSTIANFEQSLVTLGGVTQATEAQLSQLEDTARRVGASTRFSATEASEGLLFLARAGFDAQESIEALPATLNLAQVGLISVGQAADFASNIVTQFGLSAASTADVVDALVIAANRTNTSVSQAAEALKFAGSIAGTIGLNVQETANIIGVLGDRGIQASLAGTNLRGVLLALASPSEQAKSRFEQFNIAVEDLDLRTNDLTDVFRTLAPLLSDTGAATDVFGRRNTAAAQIIALSTERLEELSDEYRNNRGEADRLARAQEQTLIGSFKALQSAVSEAALTLGERGLTGALQAVVNTMTDTVRIVTGTRDETKLAGEAAEITALAFEGLAIAAAAAGAAFVTFKLGTVIAGLGGVAAAASAATAGVTALGVAISAPIVAPAVAATAVFGGLATAIIGTERAAARSVKEIRLLADELARAREGTVSTADAFQRASFDLERALEFDDQVGQLGALRRQIGLLEDELFNLGNLKPNELIGLDDIRFDADDVDALLSEEAKRKISEQMGIDFEAAARAGSQVIPVDVFREALEQSVRDLRDEADNLRESAPPIPFPVNVDPPKIGDGEDPFSQIPPPGLGIGPTTGFDAPPGSGVPAEVIASLELRAKAEQLLLDLQRQRADAEERQAELDAAAAERATSQQVNRDAFLESLREENVLIGRSAEEIERITALREADNLAIGLSLDQRQEFLATVDEEISKRQALQAEVERNIAAELRRKAVSEEANRILLQGLEDAIFDFNSVGDVAKRVFDEIRRAAIRAALAAAFAGGGGNPLAGGGFRNGQGGVTPFDFQSFGARSGLAFGTGGTLLPGFQNGGIARRPTSIASAGGIRPIAEVAPEAVLPLERGNDGRLGISAVDDRPPINFTQNINGVVNFDGFQRSRRQSEGAAKRQLQGLI